jgi:hypothetical protein
MQKLHTPMKIAIKTILFSSLSLLFFVSCSSQKSSVSANLMEDGIFYDPDIQPITLSSLSNSDPSEEEYYEEDEFDYFDPEDSQALPPLNSMNNSMNWGMGMNNGFCSPMYDPFYDPYYGMGMSPGWNWGVGYNSMMGWNWSMGYGMGMGMNPWMGGPSFGFGSPMWGMPYYPYNPWLMGFGFGEPINRGWRINTSRPSRTAVRGGTGNSRPINGKKDPYETHRQIQSRQVAGGSQRVTASNRPSWSSSSQQSAERVKRESVRRQIVRETPSRDYPTEVNRNRSIRRSTESEVQTRDRTYRGRPAVRTEQTQQQRSNWQEMFRGTSPSNEGSSRRRSSDYEEVNRPSRSSGSSGSSRSSVPSTSNGRSGNSGGSSNRSMRRSR